MKRLITLMIALVLAACSMSPAPTREELLKMETSLQDTEYVDAVVISDDESMSIEFPLNQPQDTTKKKVTKKEEIKKIQDTYDIQQKNVMKQIDKLEDQQVLLDSILKKKKEENR